MYLVHIFTNLLINNKLLGYNQRYVGENQLYPNLHQMELEQNSNSFQNQGDPLLLVYH